MKKNALLGVMLAIALFITACTPAVVSPTPTITPECNTGAPTVTPIITPECNTGMPTQTPKITMPVTASPSPSPTVKPTSTPTPVKTPKPTPTPVPKPMPTFSGTVQSKVVIKSVGDIMCHGNNINSAKTAKGYDFTPWFEEVTPLLADADLAIANLETTLNGRSDSKYAGYPSFNTPEQILDGLKAAGINFLFTSNNHSLDTRYNGVKNTIAEIKDAGLDYTGTYLDKKSYNAPCIREINGIKIGFMNYTYATNTSTSALPSGVRSHTLKYINYSDPQPMYNEIKRLKAAGAELIIAGLHWGVEYSSTPQPSQRKLAQNLFEHGVDIIFGGHPHCVQRASRVEVTTVDGERKACYVAYSMGNFIADQRRIEKKITETGYITSITAVKDEKGRIFLEDFSLTPIWLWRKEVSTNKYFYQILPLGKYATMDAKPEWMDTKSWNELKKEWSRVKPLLKANGTKVNLE